MWQTEVIVTLILDDGHAHARSSGVKNGRTDRLLLQRDMCMFMCGHVAAGFAPEAGGPFSHMSDVFSSGWPADISVTKNFL